MSSPSLDAGAATPPGTGTVRPLLDLAFGFFVWAVHLLVVYIGTALACVLGLGAASRGSRTMFVISLGVVTLLAVAVVVSHALRRYRQHRTQPAFRTAVAMGGDAIACVAIAWQLFPLVLVPVCA
jgi:hypothetical protein